MTEKNIKLKKETLIQISSTELEIAKPVGHKTHT
jgi:hypothetical protein